MDADELTAARILGARDGMISALLWVRREIAHIDGRYAPKISPRHVRKLAERKRLVAPLKELERRLDEEQQDCATAYGKRMQALRSRDTQGIEKN